MNSFIDPVLQLAFNNERMLKLPVFRSKFKRMMGFFREMFDFLEDVVDMHEERMKQEGEMDEPNDFIDAYLMEQKKCEKIGDPHYYS
jgi:transposase